MLGGSWLLMFPRAELSDPFIKSLHGLHVSSRVVAVETQVPTTLLNRHGLISPPTPHPEPHSDDLTNKDVSRHEILKAKLCLLPVSSKMTDAHSHLRVSGKVT